MQTVVGRMGIIWDCPECDHENASTMVPLEVSDEDIENQPELGEQSWCTAPDTVKCGHCKKRFKLIDQSDVDDDDEE